MPSLFEKWKVRDFTASLLPLLEGPLNHPIHHDADPRIAFIYQEALRGLVQQQNQVESMNTRAGNLIFAAAFVSSLFGSQALPNGIGGWDAAALACLFALGIVIVVMLWPYAQYKFRFDPRELLQQYVDSERQATLTQMHRELALRIEKDREENWRIMQRLRASLQFALILLLLEILSWLMSLAGY